MRAKKNAKRSLSPSVLENQWVIADKNEKPHFAKCLAWLETMTARRHLDYLQIILGCFYSFFLVIQIARAEEFTTFGTIPHPAGAKEGFPRVYEFQDGSTFRLRGRIDTDALWSIQDARNISTFGDLGSVVGLRRARVGGHGYLGTDRRYIAEIDLASGTVVPRDIFIGSRKHNGQPEMRLGHYREPFSLEGGTSANFYAFMERSPVNNLDPARSWGLSLFNDQLNDTTTFATGLFHDGVGQANFEGGDGAAVGLTSRLTASPILEGDGEQVLHLGLVFSERLPERGVVVINQISGSPLLEFTDSTTSPFVPTIRIPASYQQLFNAQIARVWGPLWTQAEWYGTLIPQHSGALLFFHGYYASAGYFLTGEYRKYQKDDGVFGPVNVRHPWLAGSHSRGRSRGRGGWELVARYAYLDYFDPNTPLNPKGAASGIRLGQATIGLNWYLADRLRVLFNYNYALPNEPTAGASEASVFGTRLNVHW
jgi:phosphate-selective porin OprO/OprP